MSIAGAKTSLWNTTDHTFHIKLIDEMALRVSSNRIASSNLWLGVLFTLALSSILLSTSQQRKGPIFITQCLAFILGIIYNSIVQVKAFWRHDSTFRMPGIPYSPRKEDILQTIVVVLEHWIPLVANTAVIFKLNDFYPPQLYSLKSRIIRMFPPMFLLFSRTIFICYITYITNKLYTQASSAFGQVKQTLSTKDMKLFNTIGTCIFALEAAFCLYASTLLIYKMVQFYRNLTQMDGGVIKRKSRLFLEITCMTFVPPMVLSIVAAIQLHLPDTQSSKYRDVVTALANISVVFSLLATSWSTIRSKNVSEETVTDMEPTLPLVTRFYLEPDQNVGINQLTRLQGVGNLYHHHSQHNRPLHSCPHAGSFRESNIKTIGTVEDVDSIPLVELPSSTLSPNTAVDLPR